MISYYEKQFCFLLKNFISFLKTKAALSQETEEIIPTSKCGNKK